MKKNVIIYCRVSTDKQSKTGESLEVQEEQCRDYCKRNDYQVLAVFSEQFTWTKAIRPKVEEALDFIRHSELKIDHVIVLKIDRVSRWWIVIHDSFKKKFQDLWVSLKDTHGVIWEDKNVVEIEWINTDKYNWSKTNINQIAENVTVMMSENERNTILQRLLWQAIKNNKRGYKVRNSEYGFRNTKVITEFWKKTIQVDNPEESIFIKKMFELKARWDLKYQQIVDEINLMGYKWRTKVKWNREKTQAIWTYWWAKLDIRQLQRYLSHPVYAWVICEEWTWHKAVKTPYNWLVSIDLWNRANRGKYKINFINNDEIYIEHYKWETKLEAPIVQKYKNYNPEYPFWRVLKCPLCWWHLTAEKSRSKNWEYHYYYSCRWKHWTKHQNYGLRREEINNYIEKLFYSMKFDKKTMLIFGEISENIFEIRKNEMLKKNELILQNVQQLETKKKHITDNIWNILNFPDLLEAQNEEVKRIKNEIDKLKSLKLNIWEGIGLDRFKERCKKTLEHLDKFVLQREKPEVIQLIFDIAFEWNIEYEKLQSRTPITSYFWALNAKKDSQKNWKSLLNREWWDKDENYQTIYNWIVNLIDKIDKWQYVIDRVLV